MSVSREWVLLSAMLAVVMALPVPVVYWAVMGMLGVPTSGDLDILPISYLCALVALVISEEKPYVGWLVSAPYFALVGVWIAAMFWAAG